MGHVWHPMIAIWVQEISNIIVLEVSGKIFKVVGTVDALWLPYWFRKDIQKYPYLKSCKLRVTPLHIMLSVVFEKMYKIWWVPLANLYLSFVFTNLVSDLYQSKSTKIICHMYWSAVNLFLHLPPWWKEQRRLLLSTVVGAEKVVARWPKRRAIQVVC